MKFNKLIPLIAIFASSVSTAYADSSCFTKRGILPIYQNTKASMAGPYKTYQEGALDKPVIFVPGYDPAEQNCPETYYNKIPQELKNYFASTGRDLVVLNLYPNSGETIEYNSQKLTSAINEINNKKIGNYPVAVVGYSMGGLIARWALKDMELKGQTHNASLYISLDAPHRGANVPYDFKLSVDKLTKSGDKLLGFTPDGLTAVQYVVGSPAAREMILWQADASRFYRALEALGYPDNVVKVAYSNGSGNGVTQNLPLNTPLLSWKFRATTNVSHMIKTTNLNPCNFPCSSKYAAYYDNAPGGTGAAHVDLNNGFEAAESNAHNYHRPVYNPSYRYSFVPLISALDLPETDLYASVTNGISSTSRFDEQYALTNYTNAPHDTIPYEHAERLINTFERYHVPGAISPRRVAALISTLSVLM